MLRTSRPTVSIVTSLYDKAGYIERTARSVLAQTYGSFEWIVVDDGSTDGSPDLLPDDPRIKLIRQQNAGMAAAVNRAAAEARGEFITFLDADDTFLPHKLAVQVKALRAHPGHDWVLAGFESHTGHGSVDRLPLGRTAARGAVFPMDDAFEQLDLSGKRLDALLLKREIFEEIGGLCDEATPFDHIHFFSRLALAHPRGIAQQETVSAYDLDVAGSLYKQKMKRIEARRAFAGFYRELASRYPRHERELMRWAEASFCRYARGLGLNGRRLRGFVDLVFRYRGVRTSAFAAAVARLLTPEPVAALAKGSAHLLRGLAGDGLAATPAPAIETLRSRA